MLLAGFYPEDCSAVIRWLADAQPDVAARKTNASIHRTVGGMNALERGRQSFDRLRHKRSNHSVIGELS